MLSQSIFFLFLIVRSTKETFISSEKKVQQNVSWLQVIVHEVHFAVIRSYRPFCTEGGPEGPPWVPLGGVLLKIMSLKGGSIELGMF